VPPLPFTPLGSGISGAQLLLLPGPPAAIGKDYNVHIVEGNA